MVHLVFEFPPSDAKRTIRSTESTPPEPALSEIETVRTGWQRDVIPPYVRYLNEHFRGNPRKLSFSWNPIVDGAAKKFEFDLDATFFDQVLQLYIAFGWSGLEKLKLEAKNKDIQILRFVSETIRNVAVLISYELGRLELHLVTLAGKEWSKSLDTLRPYKSYFQLANKNTYKFIKPYEEMGREIFKLCGDYARLLEEYKGLRAKMEERNRKDRIDPKQEIKNKVAGKPVRKRTHAQAVWYELFAAPQREVMKKLNIIVNKLNSCFPPTLLVLENLPSEVKEPHLYLSYKLDNAIRVQIDRLINQLEIMRENLKGGLQTDKLRPFMQDKKMPDEGPEGFVHSHAAEGNSGQNHIMADIGLVERWLGVIQKERPVSWEHAVARRYYLFLRQKEAAEQEAREQREVFWEWVNVALAVVSIVALIGSIAATGGAGAAPAMALVISITNSAAFALTIAVIVHGFMMLQEIKEDARGELEDRMYRLSQTDPSALMEVGRAIQNNAVLKSAITTELLSILFQQAIAGKFKAIAWALDVQGFFGDMDTLVNTPLLITNK